MPLVQKQAVVPFTTTQMYQLINDIERYPEFIPWCVDARLLDSSSDEIRAKLVFQKGRMKKEFSTCNYLTVGRLIELELIDGPFKYLEGFWSFESIDVGSNEGCQVRLHLNFAFNNRLLDAAFGKLFNGIVNQLVDTFNQRAVVVYGR